MEIKAISNTNEIEKLLKIAGYKKSSSFAIYYVIIIFSAILSLYVAINMHTESIVYSSMRFTFAFFSITSFLTFFNYHINKLSIISGLYQAECIIEKILVNDWSSQLVVMSRIHANVITHPVFKAIIGLYICNYGELIKGSKIISEASNELPLINQSISSGIVISRQQFRELKNQISSDIMPNVIFINYIRLLSVFITILTYSIGLLLLIAFCAKFFGK